MIELEWAGESLTLLPERAVWWARRRTLLVADLHLGKAAAFRFAGVPVPDGCGPADLKRLGGLVERFKTERLVILGDLLHAKAGRSVETLASLAGWRARYERLDVVLVRGNHDAKAGDPPAELGFRVMDEPAAEGGDRPIMFTHYPECGAGSALGTFCGHLHPAVRLIGAVSSHRAPCFWVRPERLVLPAFGSFTGGALIVPREEDRVFAIGDGEVVEVRMAGGRRVRDGKMQAGVRE